MRFQPVVPDARLPRIGPYVIKKRVPAKPPKAGLRFTVNRLRPMISQTVAQIEHLRYAPQVFGETSLFYLIGREFEPVNRSTVTCAL